MLAYRLQEFAHGGLSGSAKRKLQELEAKRIRDKTTRVAPLIRLSPGVSLIRDWKGVRHKVEVTPAGFVHQGVIYGSLSEVARAITGTRWNGPLFFGLRDKLKGAA